MIHLGDITTINGAEIPLVDVVTGGAPCFPEGTLILTAAGYTPIEKVRVGDMVLTHKGRWRPVTVTGNQYSQTVLLKGNHYGLVATPNHPFYSKDTVRTWNGNGYTLSLSEGESWTPASQMQGKRWAVPTKIEPLPCNFDITPELMYVAGRYLADGWVRNSKRPEPGRNGRFWVIYICANKDKTPALYEAMEKVFPTVGIDEERTNNKLRGYSKQIGGWLLDNFGHRAHGKHIPSWVYGIDLKLRQALLDGYLDGDGYKVRTDYYRVSTVSKKLAHGIRLLGETLHYSGTVFFCKMPKTTVIEGRTVNQRDQYQVSLIKSERKYHLSTDTHHWHKCRNATPYSDNQKVYNITVADDHSYVVEGFVVHNCQDLSIAGKRAGLMHEDLGHDETTRSGLFMDQLRIIREMRDHDKKENGTTGIDVRPRYMVYENVFGALSSNNGNDFRIVLEETARVSDPDTVIPRPPGGVWRNSGAIMGGGFSIAWRVFDAQFWGVPQRRRRIYLVADFGGGSAPEILFEREGLRRHTPQGESEGQGAARSVEVGTGKAICIDHVITTGGKCTAQGPCIKEEQSFTLKASGAHAVATGFDMYNQEVTGVVTRTLKTPAGGDDLPVVFENHSQDTRYVETPHVAQTVSATYGMGGNNQPFVVSIEPGALSRGQGNRIWEEVAPTLRAEMGDNQPCICLNDQGGSVMDVSEDVTATLRAEAHGNLPAVIDSPKLMKLRSGKEGGGKGPLIQDNLSGTITVGNDQTLFEPVCYGISSYESNSMKSDNPHSGVYEADTSRTIDLNGGNPACNQGGIAIVQGVDGYNSALTGDVASTTGVNVGMSTGRTSVLFNSCGHGEYEEGVGTLRAKGGDCGGGSENLVAPSCFSMQRSDEYTETDVGCTMAARQYKSATDIITGGNHTVRRLTVTECARLMGFPDDWGHLAPFNPEDAEFWEQVRKTYAEINGKTYKPVKDIKKWYDKLHTDSAEYKMWGNGIALPNAEYVLDGLALHGVKTLGSLFDGSGGFPLAGIKCGIKPIWASEVEPYPIAVTKSKSWLWG